MFITQVQNTDRPNKKWEVLYDSRTLTIRNNRRFRLNQGFFTMGSCFAEEIRKALTAYNVSCFPEYNKINLDPSRMRIDTLPEREHMNYYNTFSIRQEIERAAGLWKQDKHDIWELKNRDIENSRVVNGEGSVFQDPYRRLVFGRTEDDLWDALDQINVVIKDGLKTADVCVMTLGMTEVFKKKNNGLVCNQVPVYGGGSGLRETYFYASNYEENLNNMRTALRLLKQLNEKVEVVLTVSPVPLHRSFNENDIFVNNMESKATLRAVAAQICREFDWVHYFPSFEIVWGIGAAAYKESDMLHVKEDIVSNIMGLFLSSHCVLDQQAEGNGQAQTA